MIKLDYIFIYTPNEPCQNYLYTTIRFLRFLVRNIFYGALISTRKASLASPPCQHVNTKRTFDIPTKHQKISLTYFQTHAWPQPYHLFNIQRHPCSPQTYLNPQHVNYDSPLIRSIHTGPFTRIHSVHNPTGGSPLRPYHFHLTCLHNRPSHTQLF